MNRRKLIGMVGSGITAGIAGCSTDNSTSDGGSEDQTDTKTPTATTDSPTEAEPAEFEVVEYNVPSTVEINENFKIEITIRNTGGKPGDFSEPLYVRTSDIDWQRGGDWTFKNVNPGETVTGESNEGISLSYINRYEFRLGDSERTAVLQTVSAKLSWGNEFNTPEGYRIRVDEPSIQKTYEYENFREQIEEKEPENGGQWAFVNVWVKNETGGASFSPSSRDFGLLYGNSQSDSITFVADDPLNKGRRFEGGELQAEVERSGWILFKIPDELTTDDVTMAWSEETFTGQVAARWGQ